MVVVVFAPLPVVVKRELGVRGEAVAYADACGADEFAGFLPCGGETDGAVGKACLYAAVFVAVFDCAADFSVQAEFADVVGGLDADGGLQAFVAVFADGKVVHAAPCSL